MKLTEKTIKALRILRKHGDMRPARFAEKMWPNSEKWSHPVKCGTHGVHRGGGMYMAAGGYLGRLARRGLVIYVSDYRYRISVEGGTELSLAEAGKPEAGEGKT